MDTVLRMASSNCYMLLRAVYKYGLSMDWDFEQCLKDLGGDRKIQSREELQV